MRIFTLIFVLIILFIGISFAVLNANDVTIHYYVGSAQMPLSFLLALALIIGVFLGLLTSCFMVFRAKAMQRQLRKQLQNELNRQRALSPEIN